MRDDGPRRLKHDPGAPPELSRALDALRKGSDEAPRLERVGAKLGALLDAPAPVVSSAGGAAYKAPVLKLIFGGLLLLAPLAWLMRGGEDASTQESARPSAGVLTPPSVATVAPAAPQPAAMPADALAQEAAPALQPALREESQERHASRSAAPERMRRPSSETRQVAAEPSQPPASAEPVEAPQLEQAPTAAPEESETSDSDEAAATAKSPAAKPTPSEAQLLMAARKAMPDDAERALRLLSQHQQHYADGVFVPEREVLAIEALRSLGRSAEASARLQQFKAQYPGSFHLRRLQRP